MPLFNKLSETEKQIARDNGYHGIFSARDTVEEALEYAGIMSDSLKGADKVALMTACMVLNNTWAIRWAKEKSND